MATQAQVDQALSDMAAQVTKNTSTEDSASVVLNGFAGRLQAALDAYKAANPTVTDAQVAGIQAEITGMSTSNDALSAAVAANTEAP